MGLFAHTSCQPPGWVLMQPAVAGVAGPVHNEVVPAELPAGGGVAGYGVQLVLTFNDVMLMRPTTFQFALLKRSPALHRNHLRCLMLTWHL